MDAALQEALALEMDRKLLDAIRHLPLAGGKRLRPAMAMVVADAISGSGERTIPFGVALELTHNFTLIHDDLMDRDDLRRGVITVHKAFDEPTAINAGDVLFARAFEVLTDIECDDATVREIVRDLARTVRLIGEGQQNDMDFERAESVEEGQALRMIELKTAVLFETACRGGALIAGGTPEQVEAMRLYGLNVGIGFQLQDDLLDILSDEATIGKDRWSDLREGMKSVVLIHALRNARPKDRALIEATVGREGVTDDELAKVVKALQRAGSITYARDLAKRYADIARSHLAPLPPSGHRDVLEALVDYMVTRER